MRIGQTETSMSDDVKSNQDDQISSDALGDSSPNAGFRNSPLGPFIVEAENAETPICETFEVWKDYAGTTGTNYGSDKPAYDNIADARADYDDLVAFSSQFDGRCDFRAVLVVVTRRVIDVYWPRPCGAKHE